VVVVFFSSRRRHTSFSRDWSSDVCSSDLELLKRLPDIDLTKIESQKDFKFGTILKITDLRDDWEDFFVEQVFNDLEVLVPPKEEIGRASCRDIVEGRRSA